MEKATMTMMIMTIQRHKKVKQIRTMKKKRRDFHTTKAEEFREKNVV